MTVSQLLAAMTLPAVCALAGIQSTSKVEPKIEVMEELQPCQTDPHKLKGHHHSEDVTKDGKVLPVQFSNFIMLVEVDPQAGVPLEKWKAHVLQPMDGSCLE